MANNTSILRDSIKELNQLKQEAYELAKNEAINEIAGKIEESAKAFLEKKLYEGFEDGEESKDEHLPEVEPTSETEVAPESGEGHEKKPVEITVKRVDQTQIIEPDTIPTFVDSAEEFNFGDEGEENNIDNNEEKDLRLSNMEDVLKEYLAMDNEDEVNVDAPAETEVPAETETTAEVPAETEAPVETPGDASAEAEELLLGDDESADDELTLTEEELDALEKEIEAELAKASGSEQPQGEQEVAPIQEAECTECEEEAELEEANQLNLDNKRNQTAKPEARDTRLDEAKETFNKINEMAKKLVAENETLKAQNAEYKKVVGDLQETVSQFKEKLYEASLSITKTSAANKLFIENTTTQDQKREIISSLAGAASRDEVKNLYESLTRKFNGASVDNKQEIFESKVSNAVRSDKSTLTENTVYNNQFKDRFKHLVGYKPQ
jgi:hypothetical protein